MVRERAFILVSLSLALGATSGCAHYSATALDSQRAASAMAQQREAGGLYVAAEDLTTARDSVQYFARDLVAHGYAPILMLLETSQDSRDTFDINRHDMRLVLRDGTRLETAAPEEISEEVRFSHWRSAAGFFFMILPGFFVASSVNDANEALRYDYKDKGFEAIRMSPNVTSHRGAIFFRIPEERVDGFTTEDAFIEVRVYKRDSTGSLDRVFDLPVHFGD